MKLSILLSVILLLLFTYFPSHSQEVSNYQNLRHFDVTDSNPSDLYFYGRKMETEFRSKGLPSWQSGILLTTTSDTLAVQAIINIPKDEIQILIHSNVYTLYQEKVAAIVIGTDIYISSEYPHKDQLFSAYFKLIHEGKTTLLLKNDGTYYFKKQEQPAQKVKRSKKGLLSIFEHQKDLLKQTLQSKKLNPKNNDDLLQIFSLMNQASK